MAGLSGLGICEEYQLSRACCTNMKMPFNAVGRLYESANSLIFLNRRFTKPAYSLSELDLGNTPSRVGPDALLIYSSSSEVRDVDA